MQDIAEFATHQRENTEGNILSIEPYKEKRGAKATSNDPGHKGLYPGWYIRGKRNGRH